MNISKKALQTYRKYLASKLAIAFSFTVFVLACLAIGIIGSYLFLILVPVVVLPIFICLQLANSSFARGMPLTQKNFFSFYRTAFTPPLNGAYQVLSSFLKAVLINLGLSFVVVFAMLQLFVIDNSSFAQEVDSIAALAANGNFTEALAAYEANANIIFISSTATLISGGFALLAFLHFVGRNSIVPHLALSMSSMPGRIAFSIHREGLKFFKREFNTDYYRATWMGAPIILAGFAAGVFATYFFTQDPYLILLSGLAGAFILLAPFLPYYLDVIEELFKKYKERYISVSIDQAKKAYEEIKVAQKLSEEQQEELDKLIGDLQKKSDDAKREDDDLDNDENNE
ncbi:MAG: hypothetical protein WCS76_00365 [Bacilli bacterium]|jgi:hypothetical protein